jgi:hypothetical protein
MWFGDTTMEITEEFEDRINNYFVGGISIFILSFLLYMILTL